MPQKVHVMALRQTVWVRKGPGPNYPNPYFKDSICFASRYSSDENHTDDRNVYGVVEMAIEMMRMEMMAMDVMAIEMLREAILCQIGCFFTHCVRDAVQKKNGIFWEFFPSVGPPPLLGTPVSKKKCGLFCVLGP